MFGKNIYQGHRYVPLICGIWDKSKDYEGLSIVLWCGASYTSKKHVPPNIDITNEEYWVLSGNYNAQVEMYRREVLRVSETFGELENGIKDLGLNVKIFGAYGDGAHDDTQAIQCTIDYASSHGYSKVFIPNGDYLISAPLVVNSKIAIEGQSKRGSVIQLQTDIDAFHLMQPCTINSMTIKILTAQHFKAIFKYFAILGGSKDGQINDIYVLGAQNYTNETKVFEFAQVDGSEANRAWLMFWDIENIYAEFCWCFWYTEADFNNCWTTACTFSNCIIERCRRAVYFNTTYIQGYFSRYDFIQTQFQCNTQMQRVYESPSNRSIIDIHLWDRPSFPAEPKSILIKDLARDNVYRFRNIDFNQVEIEKPVTAIRNLWELYDDPRFGKNIFLAPLIYVDGVNGDDNTADGTTAKPYKTLKRVLDQLPQEINDNITIRVKPATYNETIKLDNYYGGGVINIIGDSAGVKIKDMTINNNRLKLLFRDMDITATGSGNGVLVTDTDLVFFINVNITPSSSLGIGYFLQATKAVINPVQINNCSVAVNSTALSNVRVDGVTGSGNTTGLRAINCGEIRFVQKPASSFATTVTSVASGGTIIPNNGMTQATGQSNSSATDVTGLRTDFNTLLGSLRTAGLIS